MVEHAVALMRHDNGPGDGRGRFRFLALKGLLGILSVAMGLLCFPAVAAAHPLDQFLQATYLTLTPTQVQVELDLTPGVLVAPQVLPALDTNGDGAISAAEGQAYAEGVLRQVTLQIDHRELALAVARIDMPPVLNLQTGYGTIRIFAATAGTLDLSGAHQLSYRNAYHPTTTAYQVNAFVGQGAPITLGPPGRDPLQQSLTLAFTGGAAPASTAGSAGLLGRLTLLASPGAWVGRVTATMRAPAPSPWLLALAFGFAMLLGGLHALTPGHGKTLMAAYLVGSRGTARHAFVLGGMTALTHTSSVVAIGGLALLAGRFAAPGVLAPLLGLLSGLLVVGLGVRLVRTRWRELRAGDTHHHAHDHHHDHEHGPAHGHHVHAHAARLERVGLRELAMLGVSGGMLPCPEALAILIVAVGLDRAPLGIGLIVSFSLGLAAVLIGLGVLLVRAKSLVNRVEGLWPLGPRLLPVASAVIVTILGLGIVVEDVLTYLG